jgi:RNA polymerase sigma factor (sigma-70 family)
MKSFTTLAALVAHCHKLARRHQAPDGELLRRFAGQRDVAAFEELVERYAAVVWGVCRRMLSSEADCEDAFQATFLVLVRRASSIALGRPLGAWLHTVAVHVSNKARARALRQPRQTITSEPAIVSDVADELGNRELFRIVDEEIAHLPALLREPFVLCCLEGRTRDEAAAELECSVAAIKSRLERSRDILRRRLERRGFGLPAAFLVLGLTESHVRASLRAKALQAALGCASPAVAALVPTASLGLASKLTLTAMSLVMTGVLGFGAVHVMQAKPPQETPHAAKESAPKAYQPPGTEKSPPRLDRFGDPLPEGAIRRFGTLRFRHVGICNLVFTPDGKQLIAGEGTAPLAVFDAATGRKLRSIGKASPNNFGAIALSPDGKRVACCGFDLSIWDLETGQLIRELGCGRCQSVAFSPDGKKVAVVPEWRAEVAVVEVATGKRLAEWMVKQGWVNQWNVGQYHLFSLAYSLDGKFLAGVLHEVREKKPFSFTVNSMQLCLLDAAKGTLVRSFGSPEDPVYTFAFQPRTGRLAAGGKTGLLRFWDTETGKKVHQVSMGEAKGDKTDGFGLSDLRFSADGRRCAAIVAGQRYPLIVLDTKDGRELRRIDNGEVISMTAVALSPDGKVIASGKLYKESCVRVWDVESGAERLADAGHRTSATLSLSADGHTLISEDEDGRVIHWDLRTGNGEVRPSVESPNKREKVGRRIATRESQWQDWTLRGPRWRLSYKSQPGELEVWSLDGSKQIGKVRVPELRSGFALSPDGAYLAYAFHEGNDPLRPWRVLVWDPERDRKPRQFSGDARSSSCADLRFTHDGKRLIAGINPPNPNRSETIWIWDVAEAKIARKLPVLNSPGEMVLSADDRLLITGDMGRVWEMETGKELARLVSKELLSNLFLSPDDRFLAGVSNDSLNVWETYSWKPIRSFASSPSPHSMLFSRDGRSLFVANNDSTILEWDVSSRAASGRLTLAGEILAPDHLNALSRTLADTPDKAYPAVWEMLAHPAESVPYLIGKLSPVKPIDAQRVRRLLGQLDAESFAEREEAGRQLLTLGEQALPVLRQAVKDKPTLETKKRIEELIESLNRGPTPEQLRLLRALAVLEWSNRPEAVEHLRQLAGGAPSASLTQAAKAAARRLQER